jgi:hypothetical protein
MMLSICIATIPERRSLLSRMLHSLAQPGINETFEILCHQGTRPHGEKINRMVSLAEGSHVTFLDDDDWVASDYVASLTPHGEDFVGYDTVCLVEGRYDQTVTHDAQYEGWNGTRRGVSQKCPILRELALEIPYPDDYYQDGKWSASVQLGVRTHAYVPKNLYFYDYRNQDRHRSVGMWPYDKSEIRWL